MRARDLLDGCPLVEVAHRVPAEQLEVVRAGQLIPQHLEANRGGREAVFPEDVNHLAERADGALTSAAARQLFEKRDHSFVEPRRVDLAEGAELRQRVA